jgi:hypothetical protein
MSVLITAAMASVLADGVPGGIVYLPKGDIAPTVNGKAKRITVRVLASQGETIAAKLPESLAERQKCNVRAWFDFEHKGVKAAALPTAFRYEQGTGIITSVEWAGTGRAVINPHFPPSGLAHRLFQEPSTQSKFLAIG